VLLDNEEHWVRNFDRGQAREGAGSCRAFYEQLLGLLEPDVVLPWNTLFPHSRILQLLCEEMDIPVFTVERGFLPDTLMLDRLRNNVESELNNSALLSSVARGYEPRPELLEAYRVHYAQKRPHKYAMGSQEELTQQQLELAAVEGSLVLALSQAHGCGIYPRTSRVARRNFAHFSSVEEALSRLVDSTRAITDATGVPMRVAFRDHPINRVEQQLTQLPSGILRLDAGPLCDVLPHARVVVSFGSSTALYEALLLQKPVIVVGDTPIGRFEPYVRSVDGELGDAIASALSVDEQRARQARADAALGFLLEHALFAEHPGVPLPRGLGELADFVASFDASCPLPLELRFRRLQAWMGG
jgi:hypothetical protein